MPPPEIIELPDGYRVLIPWGFIQINNNELAVVSTVRHGGGDPPKVKLYSVEGISLGAWAFGRIDEYGRMEEMVLLQGKQDERTRADPQHYSGELTVHIRNGFIPGDAGMIKVMELRHDGVWMKGLDTMPSPIPPSPPSPPVPTPPPPPPPAWPPYVARFIGANGKLDFEAITQYYGFESEDEENYRNEDMDARTVIDEMERRAVPTPSPEP